MADDRVKQVKQANDIVQVVGSYLALRPVGRTFKGLCPFHDDSRPSFDVDPQRQRYRCWSCGKFGDVISFVQEYEHVGFAEALELLARRAGIILENSSSSPHNSERALMLDVVRWGAQQFHRCYLDSPAAEEARMYLGQRGLRGETVRRHGLGYAPRDGAWLVRQAQDAHIPLDRLEQVGLIARRTQGPGYYDRFRDRVIFPIQDARGQTVGFGGRIMPNSPFLDRAPKYYNSTDTPLFTKSEHLYGLHFARHAAAREGYLAVVEGYTDVLMAHQLGVEQVVATLGTALNSRHVRQLSRFVSRVILVFDADAGGSTGVDRALGIFATHDVELAIATLPVGLDPCDLLVQQGADAFLEVLGQARDALEFKLNQVLGTGDPSEIPNSVEERRRAVDAVLGIIALAPPMRGKTGTLKTELMVSRIAHRLGLREEIVWTRLDELRQQRQDSAHHGPNRTSGPHSVGTARQRPSGSPVSSPSKGAAPGRAAPEERELLAVLLAEPALVPRAMEGVPPREVGHPQVRLLVETLYRLQRDGEPPTLDQMRAELDDPSLVEKALLLQEQAQKNPNDRGAWLEQILNRFAERRARQVREELQNQLHAAQDPAQALELLRRLQNRNVELDSDTSVPGQPTGSSPTEQRDVPSTPPVSGPESRRV